MSARLTQSDLRLIHAALCDYLSDTDESDTTDLKIHEVLDKIEAKLTKEQP